MSERYQQLMKLIVVGDSGTGKSSLLHRFVEDTFSEERAQTIGVEFGSKIIELSGRRIKLQIWDTAGQERYKSVTRSYYRGAVGCLIVYDITERTSYESVPQWLNDVRQLAGPDVVVMLIGNKSDMSKNRAVQHNEASLFALENKLLHFETSASTGEFVTDAFLKVAKTGLSLGTDDNDGENGHAETLYDGPKRFSCAC
ncbi:Ras-related protein Rab4 [Trypanosoma equiperdum]|uniref:Small GTPase, putative n=5 Tax=Trypanozoon TaxID=39700 RepID=Q382G2_TRYB2|nr:ras-related rab-4, putative [Trypanosoma brucei gambiense DAL972]XP_829431.1 small GTPase, putative [Trypanosoma brucei brucei TREU927]AAC46990.1 ras-related protein RAB-4 [Trypanosoma brucei rhodesiense]RHW68521.1 Ras-related protein Rab4 [Trypanosoma brucei equiperdum]SCU66260.1 Ras-related protein Rab4 [Trypanosoma equiperdum]EAN80319.1 small GTPase, putative [Trypanosoma brucei brucei TREU927]CBH18418.1 ras-related rab-4, putative [Trypanosoma brucei gambiense DAL972]|eukprot:XP_011780682.1 ras-related rab-4, putative [Trypanosoma brucei gambiense DAL972]